jgi:hypothetical protein
MHGTILTLSPSKPASPLSPWKDNTVSYNPQQTHQFNSRSQNELKGLYPYSPCHLVIQAHLAGHGPPEKTEREQGHPSTHISIVSSILDPNMEIVSYVLYCLTLTPRPPAGPRRP